MALADLDQQQPPAGYAYDGTYMPSGQLNTRYIGGGVLPHGYNTGEFLPNGQLRWASNAMAGGPAVRQPVALAPPITSVPQPPRFNLAGLFNGGLQGINNGGGMPKSGMIQTTKSSAVQKPIDAAFTVRNNNAGQEALSLKDYAAQVLGGQPQAKAAADQEINSVNQIYGTGGDSIEARLAQLNHQEQSANNIAAQRAMGQVRRQMNASRAGGGSSSYLDRIMAQQLYGIGAQNAGRGAQQGRNDLQWLTGQRTGQVGRRQSILDTLAQRGLSPAFAGQQLETGGLMNLNRLAELDYDNNTYQTPEAAMRQRLEFMDYLSPYLQY